MNSTKFTSINMFSCVGCWFGVKNHDKLGVFLPNITQAQLAAADIEDSAGKLAQALTVLLFSNTELANGCATKPRKAGIIRLDPIRLHAIRGKIYYSLYSPNPF